MSAGDCIIAWARDDQVKGSHDQVVVLCSQYTSRLKELLQVVLRDPDNLSSTDRNTILSAVHSPVDLLNRTNFLVNELAHRSEGSEL